MTRNKKERKLDLMGRRRFLNTAAAFGFGATTIAFSSQSELAAAMTGDQVEYVYAIEGSGENRTPVYKTMDRSRWIRIRAVEKLRTRLQQRFEPKFGSEGMSYHWQVMDDSPHDLGVLVAVETEYGMNGEVKFQAAPDVETVRRAVPEAGKATVGKGKDAVTIENIPIRVEESRIEKTGCSGEGPGAGVCQDDTVNFTDVPGGTPVVDYEKGTRGSMCSKFAHPSYGQGWVGAGHVHHAEANGQTAAYGWFENVPIGTVEVAVDNGWDEDYSFYKDTEDPDPVAGIADSHNSGYLDYDVVGYLSKSGIQDDADDGTDHATQGTTTCRLWNGVHSTTSDGIKTFHDIEDGDSGGIIFVPKNSSEAYISGNMTAEQNHGFLEGDNAEDDDDCSDDTLGVLAQSIEGYMNGAWGTA